MTPPPDRTLNRILKREALVKKILYTPKGVEYPYFRETLGVNHIHQADLLGARYIKKDGRFYSLHIMDLYSHRVFIHPQRRKDDEAVARGMLRCWKTMGLPDFLQVDNELSPGKQSLSALLRHRPSALFIPRTRSSFHSHRRTLA